MGVGLVAHPQGDPQVDVGSDVGGDDASRALGGQDEMDPQGSPLCGDADQSVDEPRQVLG